ncbi:lipopolysaccharide kinase InaA family protein [Pseudomonas sp. CCI3.2]|uniref:lipopolysaccharide kinase InaA family protein n=1 Tax=unclassified Pseudomonas TaxID=196821 RepID=UPI002AC8ED50|nr:MULTISPECIES: lipopolysaccharide kinase InaA family protein [unclassified Pseudomonas]MEB0075508.1 lipopolysaccharide kinase InaA family protein [Pseudomonas sp. MH10out]MEB0091086.1 lipopolysaccharide kinase InaA family protein [Pseudomonas sp. CCI4.2]MEB0101944.1 lipopolysaccharide kinase InaA family protein [Pseudomonas sp. CCI3.2]MEB0130457.1 lipopolysaccharide kinase InaA family protein [Pseudomonas sp. CCI2.4]MEB0158533.1 lipopolysaccharide kinase InaA family protein [Pseudomonas sp. 
MAVDVVATPNVAPPERFAYFWNQPGEWVEEPNHRRGGESGVQRVMSASGRLLYVKRQTGHTYRSWLHPFGRPTVLRERDALESLRQLGVNVPKLVFCGAEHDAGKQWRALLVTAALDGFDELDNWYAAGGRERYGEALHDRVLEALAVTLSRMHLGRWQHSCLYMKHVFVRVTGEGNDAEVEIALLDLEKCRRRWTGRSAAQHDLQQLRRHSSFNDTDWLKLVYFYENAFGSAIKGLR